MRKSHIVNLAPRPNSSPSLIATRISSTACAPRADLGGAGAWDGSYAARTTELQAKCRFQCCCALCNADGEAFEQSETRRRRIVDLNRLLQSVAPSSHLPSSFKKGHRKDDDDLLAQTLILFQISAEEGLPAIWQRAAIIEAMMHAKRTGYAPEALAWAERGAQSARLALGAQAPTTTKFEAIVKAWSRAMAERPDEPLPGESAGQGRSTRAAAESTESTVDDTTLLLRRACVGGRTFWAFRTIHAARLPPSAAADNRPDLTQHFSTEFEAAATAMHPLLHRALVEDAVDDDKSDLLIALLCKLGKLPPGCLRSNRRLLQRRGAIGATGCAALRQLVDSDRNVERDSVDGKSQHQLNLSFDRLEQLIGRETVKGLWRLADDLLATQRDEATTRAREAGVAVPPATLEATDAASGGYHVDLFVRRYTRDTRPWIAFHQDVSNVTLNVALSDDAHHDGGRLHAILEGRHQVITRAEGEATAHADDVMHAVSAMRGGVRYSLIAFFYVLIDTPEVACYQTIPKRELDAGSPVLG